VCSENEVLKSNSHLRSQPRNLRPEKVLLAAALFALPAVLALAFIAFLLGMTQDPDMSWLGLRFRVFIVLPIALHLFQLVLAFALLFGKNWARLCTMGFAGLVVLGTAVILSFSTMPPSVRIISLGRFMNDLIVLWLLLRPDVGYFFKNTAMPQSVGQKVPNTPLRPPMEKIDPTASGLNSL